MQCLLLNDKKPVLHSYHELLIWSFVLCKAFDFKPFKKEKNKIPFIFLHIYHKYPTLIYTITWKLSNFAEIIKGNKWLKILSAIKHTTSCLFFFPAFHITCTPATKLEQITWPPSNNKNEQQQEHYKYNKLYLNNITWNLNTLILLWVLYIVTKLFYNNFTHL